MPHLRRRLPQRHAQVTLHKHRRHVQPQWPRGVVRQVRATDLQPGHQRMRIDDRRGYARTRLRRPTFHRHPRHIMHIIPGGIASAAGDFADPRTIPAL